MLFYLFFFFFFFNDPATTEIYTLSLHDALPIWYGTGVVTIEFKGDFYGRYRRQGRPCDRSGLWYWTDRKSTRLNSSHANISYAVFCLKKKKKNKTKNIK